MTNIIVKIKFGSHLYGTNTPDSDLDIKGIYLPTGPDILLQRVKPTLSFSKNNLYGEKNTATDVDLDLYSPKKFLDLLADGQIVALDMLFAPDDLVEVSQGYLFCWESIKTVGLKLITKNVKASIGYCKNQANKYGIKGSRVAAARLALQKITEVETMHGSTAKLSLSADTIKDLANTTPHLVLGYDIDCHGIEIWYFEICGKKALFNASIKSARIIAQNLVDEYGQRALAAENNEGIDWKALSHAVRVGYQTLELLNIGHITFPRPEAQHLLDIKLGKLSYHVVSKEIEHLLSEVEQASLNSQLPESADPLLIDDFIEDLYYKVIEGLT